MKRKRVGIIAASSVAALALGAVAVGLSAQAAEKQTAAATAEATAKIIAATSTPTPSATPTAEAVVKLAAVNDPMSAEYNPYLTPGDPAYTSPDVKAKWFAADAVVRKCMTDKGLGYETAPYWLGGNQQPTGLDFDQSIAWLIGYYGESYPEWRTAPEERGCSGLTELIAAGLVDAPPVPVPADPVGMPTERQKFLAHEEIVRECMVEKGVEYLYWEWWNPKYHDPYTFDPNNPTPVRPPAQQFNLNAEQIAAWDLALHGDTGAGAEYRWEDAGCAGYATHVSGNDNMH